MEVHFKIVHKTSTTVTDVSKIDFINQFSISENKKIIIGRHPSCDIVIRDDYCSGRHCEVRIEKSKVIVKDLGSKNGTLINDSVINESYFFPDDLLKIGSHFLIYDLSKNTMSVLEQIKNQKS
jgi:pSer/pThr/pTyr-binding forkhead associated (FHA) protein